MMFWVSAFAVAGYHITIDGLPIDFCATCSIAAKPTLENSKRAGTAIITHPFLYFNFLRNSLAFLLKLI